MINCTAIFAALSAITVHLIQRHVPPSEVHFVTCTSILCLMFGAATADPETFFVILFTAVPVTKSWFPSIVKGIECLREGEERVADMKNKKKKDQIDKDDDDDAVSYEQLLEEICQRIQWKFILSSTITGLMVKYIAYEKPKVVGHMLDSVVLEGASTQTSFWPHFRPLVLFVIADYILVSMREYYKHGAAHRFNRDAKSDMIANILNQDEDFIHSERHSAGFTHLMNVECNRMQKTVNESVTRLCFGVVTTVWGVWSLVHVDRRLALLGILFKSPLLTMLQSLSRKDIVKYGRLYDASQGAAHRVARSVLCPGVIHLLQANVAQHKAVGWYREKQEDFIQYLEYTHFRQTLLCLVRHGLNNCEDVLLLAMGMTCVLDKTITMGMYFTFRSHLNQLDQGFKELIGLWDDISTIRLSSMVYFELLYRKSKIRNSDGCIKQLRDENKLTLSLNNVSFAYRLNPSVTVLDGINLQLEPGKVIALCGPSGGGKSTVTRLLQRFYDPTEGSVELNNVDIRTIDLKWLRKQIRVIDQDPVLPDLTIFENIALGLGEEASKGDEFVKEQVIEAAKLADAHNFISTKCEKGYDTPVRFISRLSGGERQRIAVARALISHAPIIICDEITASLDAETEQTVISTLSRAMEGKAVLLIAHRLSTIRHADEIAFMEKGKMVERGSHDELVKLNGRYAGYLKTLNSPESFG